MSGISPAGAQYMDSLIYSFQQKQGRVLMNLMQVAKDSFVTEAAPLRSISENASQVDLYV